MYGLYLAKTHKGRFFSHFVGYQWNLGNYFLHQINVEMKNGVKNTFVISCLKRYLLRLDC